MPTLAIFDTTSKYRTDPGITCSNSLTSTSFLSSSWVDRYHHYNWNIIGINQYIKMSEDAIEIVAFPDDENVNLLNYAPTSPRGGTKIGGVNSIAKALDGLKQALSPKSAAVALKLGSPKNLAVSPASPAAAAPAWAHQKSPRTLSPKSPDGIMKFRAVSPKFEDVDEIMAFRAGSCDSDTVDETQHVTETTAPEQQPANPVTVPEDCMNIESLRVLPTIMEAGTEDSTDNILSHPGTECASIKSSSSGEDADCSVEVLDDGSILAGTGKPESSVRSNPKKAVNLKVNVHGEQAVDEIADLDQMLSDLNDPFEGPFSPLVGENILLSPVFNQKASLVQADTTASPRRALSPRQIENTASPRGVLSPRQSTDPTSPRATLSPRNAVTPTSPGRCQEPSEQIVSPRQRQDPPSLLQEVSEEIISRRITFKTAVAEATHLKKQLDEQMSRTQEFSSKVMAKREAEAKRQKDLEKELAEVARHNEALQAEIKKLAVTKKELQEAKLEVEKEETELKQLREEHKAKCGELEKELMIENDALRSDIEKLVVTKKELIDAKFKAQKEESDLALKKKEYEDQLQLYEAEKQKLEAAMEKATIETNETNELSKKVLKELKEHKDNVEADLDLVKEMHNSQMKILMEERPKLQAATTKAEQEIAEAKANTSRILRELEEMTQKEEAEVAKLCAEHENRMKVLEREKEELANAIEQAANETTETKEMTRAVLSELEEYKMKLEVDMQNEIKDLKNEIRE